jgi:glutamate receptor, ionotropic, invertebrate
MPHIETQPNIEATVPTINLYPYPHAFGAVFLDLVKAWEWKSFTILYETGEVSAKN